jgi:cation diffusion facilitator family transporter
LEESFARLFKPVVPDVTTLSFVIMVTTMLVNFIVMSFEYQKGKLLGSDILASDSMHTRVDILTSLTVIASFVFVKLGYPVADTIFSAIIAFFIGYAGLEILRSSSKILCDEAVLDPEIIKGIVNKTEGVAQCHKIRTRGRRDDIYIDLHVLLDDATPLKKAHQISYAIEDRIKKEIPGVSDVVVHLEPLSSQRRKDQ